ncbi:MAG: nucleotide exchange factor GrpE [Bacteroidetes bacterium]|nr:nucleotide exchange factor GrpE [Bacteroidota bacterium]
MEDKKNAMEQNEDININADADIPGSTHLTNPYEENEAALEKISAELQDQKDKYLRLFAEFDNFKRRTAKERIELSQTAGKDIILSLLEVVDDCDRAEKQMENSDDISQIKQGNKLVFNKLRNVLQQKGLQAMVSIHTPFDVEKHEAISEVPAGDKLKGKVVDEIEKGYYLNDKLIRFAKVVVGN